MNLAIAFLFLTKFMETLKITSNKYAFAHKRVNSALQ